MDRKRARKSKIVQKKKLNDDLTFTDCVGKVREVLGKFPIPPFVKSILIHLMWICVSILTSISITVDNAEVKYDITKFEACYLVVSTMMLLSGLKNNRAEYLLPWSLFAIWNVLSQKYFALEFIMFTLYYENYGILPIITGFITLVLKFTLWVKVVGFILELN